MPEKFLMGIDIGTSESKGVLCDIKGNILFSEKQKHGMEMPREGWFEQDAKEVWWGDLKKISRELIQKSGLAAGELLGLCVSGLGQDLLPVDRLGNALRKNAILYGIDKRAAKEMEEMNERLGREAILSRSANAISTHSVGPKISWLKNHEPEVFEKADYFVTASNYLVAKLTGQFVLDHHQASFWVPLYDFHARCWNRDFCGAYFDTAKLPLLKWGHEIAGCVTGEASAETSIPQGTPICVGTGDAFAESISAGALEAGHAMVMYGSTTCIFMPENEIKPDEHIWSYQSYEEGLYGISMCTATSGSVTKWFKNLFARELEGTEDEIYQTLVSEAEEVLPGAGGIIFLPYFSGERSPIYDPNAKGMFFGLSLSTTRGELFRAVLEGIAYSVRHNLEVIRGMGYEVTTLLAVGGGTQNAVWLQAVSDICKIKQRVPSVTIGAAYADAYMVGVGTGIFTQMSGIRNWITYRDTIKPRQEYEAIYDEGYKIYRQLYENNKYLSKEKKL